jgi:hypothetical protein
MQAVHVRCLEDGIAVGGNIAEALVVGEDEYDVRAFAGYAFGMQRAGGAKGCENKGDGMFHDVRDVSGRYLL